MKNLAELAECEARIVDQIVSAEPSFEERHIALEQLGIPHEYAAIVTAYVDLLAESASRIEALKRATFLVWYAVSEPSDFTGLSAVTPLHTQWVVDELEHELNTSGGDDELRAMLSWYARVMGGCPFIDYPECSTVTRFVAEADAAEEVSPPWRPTTTNGRGQMGTYWRSLRSNV